MEKKWRKKWEKYPKEFCFKNNFCVVAVVCRVVEASIIILMYVDIVVVVNGFMLKLHSVTLTLLPLPLPLHHTNTVIIQGRLSFI